MALTAGQVYKVNSDVATGVAPGGSQYKASSGSQLSILGSRVVNGQTYYNIDQTKFGGGTGWAKGADLEGAVASPTPGPAPTSAPSVASPTPGATTSSPRLDFVNTAIDAFKKTDAEKSAASKTAVDKLIGYYSGLEDPTTRFNKLRTDQGVDTQQSLVNSLTKDVMSTQDTIDNTEGQVNDRTGDFLINDNQRAALVARERLPFEQNLTKLLRAKQYEEVGLAGKQALVSQLLDLSFKKDEMGAKPLQLGVDFTNEDRKTATQLFSDLLGKQASAYSADQSSKEQAAETTRKLAYDTEAAKTKFANDITLENLRSANNIKEKSVLSASENKSSKEAKADSAFNQIVGESQTEGDVWAKIKASESAWRQAGVDVDRIWQKWAALKAKVGEHGSLRTGNDISSIISSL